MKALFATLDSDSETGDASPAKKPSDRPASQKAPSAENNSATEVGSDDDLPRPRGGLASRMRARDNARQHPDSEMENNAQERVIFTPEAVASAAAGTDETEVADALDEEDEDEAVVARPRKLKNKARRSTTPDIVHPSREASPSMFVSPRKDQSPQPVVEADGSGSDEDLPSAPFRNERFLALVAKKRAEHLAKGVEEERKKAARKAAAAAAAEDDTADDNDSDIADDEGGWKLTQEGRPTRKASKKALEEMNRETQRMSRNLQLAHEAKTRKKVTKSSLFERFNFKPQCMVVEGKPFSSSRPATPVSAHETDAETKGADTPPSSPPALNKNKTPSKPSVAATSAPIGLGSNLREDERGDLPHTDTVPSSPMARKRLDKGKGKATAANLEEPHQTRPVGQRLVRVKLPVQAHLSTVDSDDELVVTETKRSKIDSIFDRVPAQREKESRSMMALRYLAQVGSPGKEKKRKQKNKKSLTPGELQAQLQQRAREQARLERERRFELLKTKGIHIQTEEEREKAMEDVEDILTRARQEAEEIMQREREEAKKERKAKGSDEVDPLDWDDSSGEDEYEQKVPSEIELSGSEEEGEEEGEEEASDKDSSSRLLFDAEAESTEESGEDEADAKVAVESDDDMPVLTSKNRRQTKKKHATVLSDDDDDDDDEVGVWQAKTPKPKAAFLSPQHGSDSPQVPTSVLRSAAKAFIPGLPVAAGGPAGLGLTQIFAGTMDDSQAGLAGFSPSQPMPTFENFPDSNFSQSVVEQTDVILDSQPAQPETQAAESITQRVEIDFYQSQTHGFDSLLREQEATQASELIDPTQDGGYHNYTPLRERFIEAPPSTVETIVIGQSQLASQHDSPLAQRRGRLRRKTSALVELDGQTSIDHMVVDQSDQEEVDVQGETAFSVMQEAALREQKRKVMEAFNKKKSKAKEMVEEQAEESEDEYAGLGGADGDDSDDESAASVKDMIDDDQGHNQADDAKLAAFFA